MAAGVTTEEFDHYVAVDNDVQIAADKTDVEICASVQAATDTGESDELDTDSTMEAGEEGEENDGPRHHIKLKHCIT